MINNSLGLLYPKITQLKNRIKFKGEGSYTKAFLMVGFGLAFWAGLFIVFFRVLTYFKGIEVFGDFLAAKLLSMVFLTFFSILIFSNVITAISSFFISEELQLIISTPFNYADLYFSKLTETIFNSSWMVLMFSLPVFISYGIIYEQNFSYYVFLIFSGLPFVVICGTLGIGVAMALVKYFPAKRLKDVLFLITIFFVIIVYFMFRFLKPERLVDPDKFFTVIDYLSALKAPTSPFLPSQWVTDILSSMLFDKVPGTAVFNMLLLWSTALAFTVMLGWVFNAVFYDAWNKTQEGKTAAISINRFFNKVLDLILFPMSPPGRSIVEKDIKIFFRDTAQWSQIFILLAIIVIYLYNISVLPMEKNPLPTVYLQNIISFINLGLAGFVISAVAVRFAYPAVSLEGDAFWIIKSSPMGLKRFLWCKFWVNFIFLVVMSEILIIFTNYLLKVDTMMMAVSAVTIFLMTFGITSLGIGCGASYPRFKIENIAQIPTGFGGLLFMILSMLFIGSIVVLEARPVYYFMMSEFTNVPVSSSQWVSVSIHFGLVLFINILVFLLPMKIGIKKLSAFEKL